MTVPECGAVLSIGDTFGVGIEGLTGPFGLALSAYLGATSVAQARAAHEPVNGAAVGGVVVGVAAVVVVVVRLVAS